MYEIIAVRTMALLAALLFWRKSDDWTGGMVSIILLLPLNGLRYADNAFINLHPGLHTPHDLLNSLAVLPIVLQFYLFPDGRFMPGWTRFMVIILTAAAMIDPILKASGSPVSSGEINIMLAVIFLGCLAEYLVAILEDTIQAEHISLWLADTNPYQKIRDNALLTYAINRMHR